MTLTFNALIEIDHVYGIVGANCLNWTLGFAQPACRTFISNLICHITSLFTLRIIPIKSVLSREYYSDSSPCMTENQMNCE